MRAMAGKTTFLHGRHPSTLGSFVPDLAIAPRTWRAVEEALGGDRVLTAPECSWIAEVLALHRHFLEAAAEMRVPAKDQKRTLAAAVSLTPDQIARAFACMDEPTHARIVTELYHAGARTADELVNPSSGALHAAAVAALANWKPTKGGRPPDAPMMLARAVLELWRVLGGDTAAAITTWNGVPSPLVAFGAALFDVVKPLSNERVRELLTLARAGFPP